MKATTQKALSRLTIILLSIVLVVSCVVIGMVIYHDNYYKSFWVNGQSMYPTLNARATYENGELIGDNDTQQIVATHKKLDYGIMDTHEKTLNKLNRFDIVVCYYGEGETDYKIKRLIAMPGETFYFDINYEDKSAHGNFYLWNTRLEEFELIAQPIPEKYIHEGNYEMPYVPTKTNPMTLADDECYVVGDNRIGNHSNDSRKVGPIKYKSIEGKAVAIEGTCEVKRNSDGTYTPINIKKHWPIML